MGGAPQAALHLHRLNGRQDDTVDWQAYTVRIRLTDGHFHFWLAPAGGMGLSQPCCVDGHGTREDAVTCGYWALVARLAPPLKSAVA